MRCAVRNCGNNNRNSNRKKWRYFHFPKEDPQLQKWIDFCQRDNINTSTACICNEHFAPEDFERNMQYELGFSRKNPTKLKPGSFPSLNRPQKLAKERNGGQKKVSKSVSSAKIESLELPDEKTPLSEAHETIEIQLCDFTADFEDFEGGSPGVDNDVVEVISKTERRTFSQLPKDANSLQDLRHLEVEILDPMNPQLNANDHVEIMDSDGDSYVKHLEHEVCTLKREVFFLKDERKKLMEEIRDLKATIQRSEVQRNTGKQLEIYVTSRKKKTQNE
ncbi:uncharacterized protein LOC108114568 [Drosophila eugracilis]|uniref:uncharacterized protein LOC108114568 n=1 Tax=Drosophila eugracilis TaxID=29029 RepID=UPI0007E71434|nr:uncharacterized protein LOC108114568 [Drosophila eugracilis]